MVERWKTPTEDTLENTVLDALLAVVALVSGMVIARFICQIYFGIMAGIISGVVIAIALWFAPHWQIPLLAAFTGMMASFAGCREKEGKVVIVEPGIAVVSTIPFLVAFSYFHL